MMSSEILTIERSSAGCTNCLGQPEMPSGRRTSFRSTVAMVLTLLVLSPPSAGSYRTLRILTYNIHHGAGSSGVDIERTAAVIISADPDIVALQEVDQGTSRSGGVYQLDRLARRTGLTGLFGRTIDFSGGEYGNGVLTNLPITGYENHPLPSPEGNEPRAVMEVHLSLEGSGAGDEELVFFATHFDWASEANKLAQAGRINEITTDLGGMRVLAGDLNAAPHSEPMRRLRTEWVDPSFAGRLVTGPDYVLCRGFDHWRVVSMEALESDFIRGTSDHLPVLLVLEERPIPGDADKDGDVDDDDLSILLANWTGAGGTGTTWETGDFDGNGAVSDVDLSLLLANWTGFGRQVPEPGTAWLLLGAAAMSCRLSLRSRKGQ